MVVSWYMLCRLVVPSQRFHHPAAKGAEKPSHVALLLTALAAEIWLAQKRRKVASRDQRLCDKRS